MKGFTTTADLPPEIRERYELTEALEGGPVFDFPQYKQYGVDFTKLTEHMADTLVKRRVPWIRRKAIPDTPEAPAPQKPRKAAAEPEVPDTPSAGDSDKQV